MIPVISLFRTDFEKWKKLQEDEYAWIKDHGNLMCYPNDEIVIVLGDYTIKGPMLDAMKLRNFRIVHIDNLSATIDATFIRDYPFRRISKSIHRRQT